MEPSIDLVATATALGTAIYTAVGLDYLALYEFDLPPQAVCNGATLIALLIGVYIGVELLGEKLRKDA